MTNSLLLGLGRYLIPVPALIWQRQIAKAGREARARVTFMGDDHHQVRDFVVRELPRGGVPLSPELIADSLALARARVNVILDELEKGMTFLFRNVPGEVVWAYPVTVDRTPHRITFNTGEGVNAAWAIDAIATPFVQGQLRNQQLEFSIQTECAHSGRLMHLEMDRDLNYTVREQEAAPLIFVPMVDFDRLEAPSIVDDFWRKSVFFWSEAEAREHRRTIKSGRGTYLTVGQAAYITPIIQGGIFAFPR